MQAKRLGDENGIFCLCADLLLQDSLAENAAKIASKNGRNGRTGSVPINVMILANGMFSVKKLRSYYNRVHPPA